MKRAVHTRPVFRQTTAYALAFVLCLSQLPAQAQKAATTTTNTVKTEETNSAALTPFMGWSTWDFIGHNPTQANVEAQAQVLSSKLASHGYNYVMLDDFWYLNPSTTVDANGRWVADTSKFPNGLAAVASYVHGLGLKFGMYLTPGIPVAAVNQNTPIAGTSYHAQDIAITSKYENNYNYGNVMYYIDYTKPGAQAYINSWASQLASWGVDFLKMDGVGDPDEGDVEAWSSALQGSGRVILFDLSNSLDPNNGSLWRQYSNAWRIDGDIECYGGCPGLVAWTGVAQRFTDAPQWAQYAGPGGWNDFDAMSISSASVDGISNDERQSYMTFWAIEAAPLYMGDDLTQLDSYGLSLLTNDEVIAVDQAGIVAKPVSQASPQQVWYSTNSDGSKTVALFNLGGATSTVTANWSNLGLSGTATVYDHWSHATIGNFAGSFSAVLPRHGSRLFKITGTSASCASTTITPYVYSNGGWSQTTTATVTSGATVSLGPQPISGGSWSWTGPNGFTSTSREIDSIPLNIGLNNFVATYTASNGCSATEAFTITVTPGTFPGTYALINASSGLALNVSGASTANGAAIIQWPYNGSTNSLWIFKPTSSGYYQIVNVNSGLDAAVLDASTATNAGIIQWQFGSAGNDQWIPSQNSDGSFTFTNLHSGQVLDNPDFSAAYATQMIQWTSNGGADQRWFLQQISSTQE